MRIGFIGLGRMGAGMASNIAKTDHDLLVFDVFAAARERFVEAGVPVAATLTELVEHSELILTSLPGPAQVTEVALGPGGIKEKAAPGTVHIDVSSNSRDTVLRLHEELAEAGVSFLDSPVSGGPAGAESGNLVLWVGGDKEVFDTHEPVLRSFAKNALHVGDIGAGTVTKLSHNLLGNMIFASIAEVFSLAVKAGMDPLELWEALQYGVVGKSRPLDHAVKQFLPNRYEPPSMRLDLGHKDVGLAVRMAKDLGVPVRMAGLVDDEIAEAVGRGLGSQDSRSFMQLQLERAGVEIEVDPDALSAAVEAAREFHRES
ncbi:NAD(P)-dependent oxidoreductase [Brevibacterium sp. VCM10]|uniref:NAD(P)-dependent oxidoreductase n=1 Tax=Brevibacterium sp. VCM10 TaxID=1381751 RepID=UPI000471E588|nr:NAD(P)-dependent oxidoreductase [Brevibacterium sp. VCM10]